MAGKQERQRKLARERYERRLAREAERQRRTRKITQWVSGGLVVLVLAGVVAFTVVHLTSAKSAAAASPSASASPPLSPSATPSPTPTGPVTTCTYTPSPPASRKVGMPPAKPDLKANYQATIKTNRGSIVIDLLNSKAPCTVNSFVYLAGQNYFNNTDCHRLTTSGIYVLQCGDPTGTGSGGPGYKFNDENLAGATYPAATVAMANSGPGTNGSQFFLVYKDTSLSPSYTPFGTIVSGLNVIQKVAAAGTANGTGDGQPKEKVVIESVTIKKT
ncbi:MAG TPA: peptidylprolyl isomerase [Streptosporangiaceae bacterium]|nr:peptidylprolyl isomerase [Streptosporangiaceae bacterium]